MLIDPLCLQIQYFGTQLTNHCSLQNEIEHAEVLNCKCGTERDAQLRHNLPNADLCGTVRRPGEQGREHLVDVETLVGPAVPATTVRVKDYDGNEREEASGTAGPGMFRQAPIRSQLPQSITRTVCPKSVPLPSRRAWQMECKTLPSALPFMTLPVRNLI